MNEFLKLKWDSTSNPSYLEKQACSFIPDDILLDSYVYQHLKKRLPKPKRCTGLNNEVNFCPGKRYIPLYPKKSSLTREQQEHILNAMIILSQKKNPNILKQTEVYSLEVFNKLSAKLADENAAFSAFVKQCWEVDRVRIAKLQNNLYRYGWACFRKKFQRYLEYGNFYKEADLIGMTYIEDDNTTIEVNCITNLLEMGTLARFSQPSLKIECRLSGQSLPDLPTDTQTNSKLPVSQDENVRKLLQDNDIDVVISSSGLKRLLDNTDSKSKWTVPVKVETIDTQKGGKTIMKKVVFIDKPFLENHQDPLDLKYFSMKRLVKTNFCQYEAFKYDIQDTFPVEKVSASNNKLIETDEAMREGLIEADEKDLKDQQNEDGSPKKEEEVIWMKKGKKRPDVIHHNANYRLWKWKKIVQNNNLIKNQTKNTELNVLIRSKLDGCEITTSGALQPVIVKPKIELQLEYGANVPTKSELSREWTSLFFRPFSNLYRVRMHWDTAEVVSIEKCTLQKVMSEANSLYEYNPYLGLGMLNELMNKLVELENGNYLLVHLPKYEHFVCLLKECESSLNTLSLESEFKSCEIDIDIKRSWVPIDLNYILPIHSFQKRPPGCFTAPFKFIKKGKGGGKKKQPGVGGNAASKQQLNNEEHQINETSDDNIFF